MVLQPVVQTTGPDRQAQLRDRLVDYVLRHGFGRLTVDSIAQRDYTLLQGVVLVAAAGYVVVNLTVDVLYSVLNPRIRVSSKGVT